MKTYTLLKRCLPSWLTWNLFLFVLLVTSSRGALRDTYSGNFCEFSWKTSKKERSFWEVATQHFFRFFNNFQNSFSVEHFMKAFMCRSLCTICQYTGFPMNRVFPYSVYAKIPLREKSFQIPSFFWSVFSCIRTEYGDLFSPNTGKNGPEKTPYLDTFKQCTGQRKLIF